METLCESVKGREKPKFVYCVSTQVSWATFSFVYLVLAFYPYFSVSFFVFSIYPLYVTTLLTALAGMCCNSASPSLLPLSPSLFGCDCWRKLVSSILALFLICKWLVLPQLFCQIKASQTRHFIAFETLCLCRLTFQTEEWFERNWKLTGKVVCVGELQERVVKVCYVSASVCFCRISL